MVFLKQTECTTAVIEQACFSDSVCKNNERRLKEMKVHYGHLCLRRISTDIQIQSNFGLIILSD